MFCLELQILGCSANKIQDVILQFGRSIDLVPNMTDFKQLVPARSFIQQTPIFAKALNIIFLRVKIIGQFYCLLRFKR